jgi:2,4-dienoyl-CoA reductase-like NADH-dependent reductase (Old Yellow Enzyme family)
VTISAAPSSMATPLLFTPLRLRGCDLRNRIVVSPMCQYQAADGHVQDWHFIHHGRLVLGGPGAIFVEATGVTRGGRITHGCTGIYDDSHIAGLKRLVDLHHRYGAISGIQLAHAGRRASATRPWDGARPLAAGDAEEPWATVGPSALPEKEGYPVPRALKESEIDEIVASFAAAAKRALAAGFDIIEVHGAHGYLLHSFFSPISNHRIDRFGGSLENRMRLPLTVTAAVRKIWPDDRPLFYRVSAVDGIEGGITIEDTIALARTLKSIGVDAIDCSSGGIAGSVTLSGRRLKPGFQVPYAAAVKRGADIPTVAVGAILDGPQAEHILEAGDADLIALGRELLADPNWPFHAALALKIENPYAVLPKYYAFYLERRAAVLDS